MNGFQKNKGIVIELTALLDVILIMLFWVMMNVRESNNAAVEMAEQRAAAAESNLAAVQQKLEELDEQKQIEIEKVWALAKDIDKNAAANQEALYGYEKGMLVTLNIRYDKDGMLYVTNGGKSLGKATVSSANDIYGCIVDALGKLELSDDDVILCALVYDGSVTLTRDYNTVNSAIERVRGVYKSFYCTYINISN